MNLKTKNLLFFTRTMKLGGTENVIIEMCEVLKPYVNKIVVCSCGGVNVEKLNQMGITHYEIPDIDNKNPFLIMKTFHLVSKIIKEEDISIVHTHHRMATFFMHFLKRIHKVTLLSTLHGIFNDKKFFTKMIYKNVNIIACGDTVKKDFVKNYGIKEENITVISNAIKKDNNEIILIENIDKLPAQSKKIGYIGRLSKEKGVELLIDVAKDVIDKCDDTIFYIVGSGDLEETLKEKVKNYKIEKNIIFLGYRNDPQNIIKQMDLIVLPSYTEGLPLTPIEAFAHGKPVVATAAGGTVDIISDNRDGILVSIGDKDGLVNGIISLVKDNNKYKEMSKEAIIKYTNEFSFDDFKDKLISYYKSL